VARQICHGMGTGGGTFDWGVLNEHWTHPNTAFERPKWGFGPTSVIKCRKFVCAGAYVRRVAYISLRRQPINKSLIGSYRNVLFLDRVAGFNQRLRSEIPAHTCKLPGMGPGQACRYAGSGGVDDLPSQTNRLAPAQLELADQFELRSRVFTSIFVD
jgi:hypothetical protein